MTIIAVTIPHRAMIKKKNLWTIVWNRNKKWSKEIKNDNFYRKVLRAINKLRAIEKIQKLRDLDWRRKSDNNMGTGEQYRIEAMNHCINTI